MTRLALAGVGVSMLAVLFSIAAGRVVHSQEVQPALAAALLTTYLPPDASFAVLVRPGDLAAKEVSQPVVDAVDALLRPAKLGISVADIDEFKFVALGDPAGGGRLDFYMVVRARRAVDWKKMYEVTPGQSQELEVNGQTVYPKGRESIWFPDDRSMVVGMHEVLERVMRSPQPGDPAEWWGHWEKAANSPLAGFLHASVFAVMELPGADGQPDRSLRALEKDTRFAVLTGNVTDKGFAVRATMLMKSNVGAVRTAPVVSSGLANFASMIVSVSPLTGDDADRLTEQLSILLESTQIVTQGKTVEIKGLVTPKMLEVFATSARLMGGQ